MGANARRRYGDIKQAPNGSGWFLSDEYGTLPIESLEQFELALEYLGGGVQDGAATTEERQK